MTAFLFAAAVLGGALNSVAGGGSFITLPALLYSGVPPVVANATSTLALWPGSVSSAVAYRRDIRASASTLFLLGAASVAGGLAGGLLLVRTSDTTFMRLLPCLMLLAAAAFTFGDRLLPKRAGGASDGHRVSAAGVLLQGTIAIYGGYFGGGMGIMMLATLSIAGMTDIHEMNGLKSILGAAINGVALVAFIVHSVVLWPPGLVMMAGGILGGYAGAALAKSIPRRHVRVIVIVVAWGMTAYFLMKAAV